MEHKQRSFSFNNSSGTSRLSNNIYTESQEGRKEKKKKTPEEPRIIQNLSMFKAAG